MLNCVEAGKPPTALADARQVSEPGDGGATSPAITAVIGERVRDDAGRHQSLFESALLAEIKELKRAISAQQANYERQQANYARAFPQRNPASKGTRFLRCIQRSTRKKECTNTSSLAVLLQRRLRGWRYRVAVSFHVTCLDSGDIPQHTRTINIYLLVHLCNLTHAHANVQESCARRRFP